MLFFTSTLFAFLIAATSVAGQSVITKVEGSGKTGVGFAATSDTTFSQYRTAKESGCGFINGDITKTVNTQAELTKAIAAGLPAPDADGKITLTMNVISKTGGGPYICKVRPDSTVTGKGTFQPTIKTVTDVGKDVTGSQQLVLQMPADLKCTGPSNSCLLRCKNDLTEPFGGCFAITDSSGAAKRDTVPRLIHEARLDEKLFEPRGDDDEDGDE